MQTPAKLTVRIFLAAGVFLAGYFVVAAAAQDSTALKSAKEKYSYALGMDLGKQLRTRSIEIDSDLFSRGLKDALSGGKTLLTEEEVRASIAELQAEAKRKQMAAWHGGPGGRPKGGRCVPGGEQEEGGCGHAAERATV